MQWLVLFAFFGRGTHIFDVFGLKRLDITHVIACNDQTLLVRGREDIELFSYRRTRRIGTHDGLSVERWGSTG